MCSVYIITPSTQSTINKAPSQPLRAEHISSEKLGWPGVSNKFIKYDFYLESPKINDIGHDFKLTFLSYSSSLLSFFFNINFE